MTSSSPQVGALQFGLCPTRPIRKTRLGTGNALCLKPPARSPKEFMLSRLAWRGEPAGSWGDCPAVGQFTAYQFEDSEGLLTMP
jgi:hypothetical protein